MGIASVLLGALAMILMFAGFLLSFVPIVGALLTFGAPALCLVGLVLGGVALSRANQDGLPTGAATAGLVVNGVVFLPSLVVALTCGMCNACATAAIHSSPGVGSGFPFTFDDAGVPRGAPWAPRGPNPSPIGDAQPPAAESGDEPRADQLSPPSP